MYKRQYKNFEHNTNENVRGVIYTPSMRRSATEYDVGLSPLGPID